MRLARMTWRNGCLASLLATLILLCSEIRGQARLPAVTTSGNQILLGGKPYFVKGICYSPFIAGDAPWVGSLTHVSFAKDMKEIKELLHANTLRVYQVLPKAFYDAARANGLMVIQGIHLQVDETTDIFEAAAFKRLKDHVLAEISRVHIARASDVILAYSVGNEMSSTVIRNVILNHQDRPRFKGTYYSTPDQAVLPRVDNYAGCAKPVSSFPDPHPFQSFLAELADAAAAREVALYGGHHLYGYATDPNHSLALSAKDRLTPDRTLPVALDFLDLIFENVYSYFPPFLRFKGYRAYLLEVARVYPDTPYLVLECGYSTSPARQGNECAVGPLCGQPQTAQPNSFCFGKNTEAEQATGIASQWQAATTEPSPVAGFCVFEYYDEWWKSDLPIDQHNDNRPEEWFGIKAVEGTAAQPLIRAKPAFETVARIFDSSWCPEDSELLCTQTAAGVELSLTGGENYDSVVWKRDGLKIATLGPGQARFVDAAPPLGEHVYTLEVRTAAVACPGAQCVVVVVSAPRFRRSDANGDGDINLTDAVFLLGYLFLGSTPPPCLDAADTDDSGNLGITDAIGSLNYLFLGSAAPPAPFPDCGPDPTSDELSDCAYPAQSCGEG